MRRPPGVAIWLLERRLKEKDRDFILGDLEERMRQIAAQRSPLAARLWYWRQAFSIAATRGLGHGHLSEGSAGRVRRLNDDLRFALRALRARPGTTAIASITLALGIGLTGGAFGILQGTVLAGLPFERSDRLVHMERAQPSEGRESMAVTPHDYLAWRQLQSSFEDLGAYVEAVAVLRYDDAPPERLTGVFLSASTLGLLRVSALHGRVFTVADERGDEPIVLLAHSTWSSRFGADPAVVGDTIPLNGTAHRVVGVMPPGFGFPIAEQFWMPLRIDLGQIDRGSGRLDVFGRLRDGFDLEAARAEFAAIGRRLGSEFPATNGGVEPVLRSFDDEYIGEEFASTVRTLLAGAGFLLLVCCANVANLLLVQGAGRRTEIAVRSALGGTRFRVARQLLLETAVIALFGVAVGLGVAAAVMRWFSIVGAEAGVLQLPHGSDALFWWNVGLDAPTLGFIAVVAVITTLLTGLGPAVGAGSRSEVALRAGTRGSAGATLNRLSRALVIVEVALAAALLIAAGVAAESALNADHALASFASERAVTAWVSLPAADMGGDESEYPDHAARLRFADRLLNELRADASIESAAMLSFTPGRTPRRVSFQVGGAPDPGTVLPEAAVAVISPGALDALGTEPELGRAFGPEDSAGAIPVALVTRTFARTYLADREPVGARVRIGDRPEEPWLQVVGVIPDLWSHPRDPSRRAGILLPLSQSGGGDLDVRLGPWGLRSQRLVVRARAAGVPALQQLRDSLAKIDPNLPLLDGETLDERLRASTGRYRVWGSFYAVFAGAALLLGGFGVASVVSYRVAVRRHEIGIRRALGATAGAIRAAVLGATMGEIGLGSVAGLLLGYWLSAGMERLMYGIEGPSAWLIAIVALVLCSAGCLAAWLPARRAARVDPAIVLRGAEERW